MNRMSKAVKILCRVLECFNWIAAAFSLLGLIAVLTGLQLPLLDAFGVTLNGTTLSLNPAQNHLLPGTQAVVFIGGVLISLARAVMFHSVAGVLCFARDEGAPFHARTVQLLRRTGALAIAQPLLGLAVGLITANHLRTELDFSSLVIGLMVLCLAQFFARGAALQQDVDGML